MRRRMALLQPIDIKAEFPVQHTYVFELCFPGRQAVALGIRLYRVIEREIQKSKLHMLSLLLTLLLSATLFSERDSSCS